MRRSPSADRPRQALARERFVAQRQMQRLGTALGVERAHMIELGARQRRLRGVERAFVFEPRERMTRARRRQSKAALARDVHPSRRLRNGGEQRRLRPGEIFDRLVEIKARGMGDAMAVQSVRREAQIMRERRLMSVARDDRERRRRLHQLFGEAARPLASACARPAWRSSRRLRVCRASSDCAMRRAPARGGQRRDDRKSGGLRERASRAPRAAEWRRAANSRNRRAACSSQDRASSRRSA